MIKKLGASAGHTLKSTGANGIKNEKSEIDKIFEHFKRISIQDNNKIVDCSPSPIMHTSEHLYTRVKKCNSESCDYYIEFHLNASDNTDANGVEVLGYNVSNKEAEKILKGLSALGFKNRGYKQRQDLYVLKNTRCPALIVELYFCTNKKDCDIADKVGTEQLARTVYNRLFDIDKKYKVEIKNDIVFNDIEQVKAYVETLKIVGLKAEIKEI